MNKQTTLMLITLLLSQCAEACDIPPSYQKVAQTHQIPEAIFYSIALAESGYSWRGLYRPWPWTLNVAGEAKRFSTYKEIAKAFLQAYADGKRPDVGLMQINAYWHRQRVDQIDALLKPTTNLTIAAQILKEQYLRSQDWWEAVGRYHAPAQDAQSHERAQRYRERVRHIHDALINTH